MTMNVVAGSRGATDQVDLRRMESDRLGDERLVAGEQRCSDRLRCECCVAAMDERIIGPTLGCDEVGVHERDPKAAIGEDELDERRLSRAVGTDDEVEAAHRGVVEPSG
jgi:hypothetical protein